MNGMLTLLAGCYVGLLLVVWTILFAHGRRNPIRPPHS